MSEPKGRRLPGYEGRLELTWTNKAKRLLAAEDGTYEWVDPSDYRVAEVRLLEDVGTVGDVGQERAADNLLIRGDALNALRSLARLPEFAKHYLGKVRLAYLDPPFNTQQSFLHYDDNLEHSVWLTMMRDRLVQIRDLLSPGGSVWVHLDDAEMAHCRVVTNEIFGQANYLGTVIWQRRHDPRNTAQHISTDHDYLIVFAKDIETCRFNLMPRTEAMTAAFSNPYGDPRGPWRRGDLAARNPYSLGLYQIETPSGRVIPGPPTGSYWRVSAAKLAELDRDGRIYWGPEWCRLEVLEAKRQQVPIVVLAAFDRGEPRSFPYIGNVPVVRWHGNESLPVVVAALLREVLRARYFPRRVEAICRLHGLQPARQVFAYAPELLTALIFRRQAPMTGMTRDQLVSGSSVGDQGIGTPAPVRS